MRCFFSPGCVVSIMFSARWNSSPGRLYQPVRLVVLPLDVPVPSIHALKAIRLFSTHCYKLDEEERESIAGLLDDLRSHTADAERLSKSVAKDILRRIDNARIKLGEDPSDDSEV